ncbi:GNAT family N-acetyltransferase [Herbiconiux moechotypicola]|nr:GNAT family N-acetyltransferase [Herbiconiux moechotypicola]MCS5729190.1 GNAT family N-acetyltransferase [Herbiconiux moechotypicola]
MSTTEQPAFDDRYDLTVFPAAVDAGGHADPATAAWIQAEAQGFHDPHLAPELVDRLAGHHAVDRKRFTSVLQREPLAGSLGADAPVATFASFDRTLQVGGAEPLPAHLISNVTVRPTHRRRGVLRAMMTESLGWAAAEGYAVAALTVSEATIYRRFGFGPATTVHSVAVTTDARFRLQSAPSGRCELIDSRTLLELGPRLFARFHAVHPGSVDRQSKHWGRIAGTEAEKGGDDPAVRAAAHYDEAGTADGYVSYRFGGWDSKPHTLEVLDLVAATPDAYLGLWDFLASVDLAERVTWEAAPSDDPLRWALADWRVVSTTSLDDWLWLRVLDPVRAFEARGYTEGAEGSLVFSVADPLGFADGVFRMRVAGGRATVERDDAAVAELAVDAPTLGSLYLGGTDARVLAAAGTLRELVPGAAQKAASLLAPVSPVWGISHF